MSGATENRSLLTLLAVADNLLVQEQAILGAVKAIVFRAYGSPHVLRCEEIEKPTANDNEVLIRVRAAAANPLDWHVMRGSPYPLRMESGFGAPKHGRLSLAFGNAPVRAEESIRRCKRSPGGRRYASSSGLPASK
jgi:hypothetical protein